MKAKKKKMQEKKRVGVGVRPWLFARTTVQSWYPSMENNRGAPHELAQSPLGTGELGGPIIEISTPIPIILHATRRSDRSNI